MATAKVKVADLPEFTPEGIRSALTASSEVQSALIDRAASAVRKSEKASRENSINAAYATYLAVQAGMLRIGRGKVADTSKGQVSQKDFGAKFFGEADARSQSTVANWVVLGHLQMIDGVDTDSDLYQHTVANGLSKGEVTRAIMNRHGQESAGDKDERNHKAWKASEYADNLAGWINAVLRCFVTPDGKPRPVAEQVPALVALGLMDQPEAPERTPIDEAEAAGFDIAGVKTGIGQVQQAMSVLVKSLPDVKGEDFAKHIPGEWVTSIRENLDRLVEAAATHVADAEAKKKADAEQAEKDATEQKNNRSGRTGQTARKASPRKRAAGKSDAA